MIWTAEGCSADPLAGRLRGLSASGDLVMESGAVWRLALLDTPIGPERSFWRRALTALNTGTGQLILQQARQDRWNRLNGQVYRAEDGLWLQQALLTQGIAVLRPIPGEILSPPSRMALLFAAEDMARTARRGLWGRRAGASTPLRRIEPASPGLLGPDGSDVSGHMHLVEGVVYAVGRRRSVWYVNFGPDWRRDFTIRLDRHQVKAWTAAGCPPLSTLKGRRVRVRGWLRWMNGPLIDLLSPFMLELLPNRPAMSDKAE